MPTPKNVTYEKRGSNIACAASARDADNFHRIACGASIARMATYRIAGMKVTGATCKN
jgi:hypothetical protein